MTRPVSASRKDAMVPGLWGRVVSGEITRIGFSSLARYAWHASRPSARRRSSSLRPRRTLGLSKTYLETYSIPGNSGEQGTTCGRKLSDQPVAGGEGRGFAAVGHAKLGQNVRHVVARRARAEEKCLGNLRVGQPLAEQSENIALAPG